jgi:hypothetical protein
MESMGNGMSTGHDYLDGVAAKLTGTYPDCSDDIAGLLEKYKKNVNSGFSAYRRHFGRNDCKF